MKKKNKRTTTIGKSILLGLCRTLGICAGMYVVLCVVSAFADDESQKSDTYKKTKLGIAQTRANIAIKVASHE